MKQVAVETPSLPVKDWKILAIYGAYCLYKGSDIYRATPAVTLGQGGWAVSSDGPPHLIASYDKEGAVMMRNSSHPDPEHNQKHNQTRGNTWFIFSKHAKLYALYEPALLGERTNNRKFKWILRNRDRFCYQNNF